MMRSKRRVTQLAAVFGTALFICAVPAIAGDCPELLGVWEEGPVYAVAASGSHAYVGVDGAPGWGWGGGFFTVIDVADPTAPEGVGYVWLPSKVEDIAVSGGYAYVIGTGYLWVIDILDPSNPHMVGYVNTSGGIAIAVDGDFAYVARGGSGNLAVIDISTPATPIITADLVLGTEGWSKDVVVVSGYVVVLIADYPTYTGTLVVVDVSVPSMPAVGGECDTGGGYDYIPEGLAVDERGYVYVTMNTTRADPSGVLAVFDVENPVQPQLIGGDVLGEDAYAMGVAVSGSFAFVAGGDLDVIDVCDPTSPDLMSSNYTPGWYEYEITVERPLVFAAAGDRGLMVYRDCTVGPLHPGEPQFPEMTPTDR